MEQEPHKDEAQRNEEQHVDKCEMQQVKGDQNGYADYHQAHSEVFFKPFHIK